MIELVVKASPAAKRAARKRGVDLASIVGSGPGGRVTEDDVAKYAEQKGERVVATSAGFVKASPAAKRAARERGVDLASIVGSGPGGRVIEEDVAKHAEHKGEAETIRATRLAKKLADEAGLNLAEVSGTGMGGRVRAQDIAAPAAAPVAGPMAPPVAGLPPVDMERATRPTTALGPAEIASVMPMAGMRRITATRMFQSAQSVARVTLTTEVDVTETVRMRECLVSRAGSTGRPRPSYTDIIVKIAARALREHPMMNARLSDQGIELLDSVNVGVAVAGVQGLAVPVIHGADSRCIEEITAESRDKIERARVGRLYTREMSGGTFTVTNIGMYEIDAFTPIINLPETGILGVGRIVEKPAVIDGQVTIRSMMYLSLTFDHRIIDGAPASAFLRTIKHYLEKPYELIAVC